MLLNRIFRTVRLPSAAGTSIVNNETTTSTTIGASSFDAGQAPIGQSFTYNLQESVDDVSWSDVSGYTGLPSPLANISTIRTLGNYYRFQGYLGSDVVMTAASAQLTEYYITGWSEDSLYTGTISSSNGTANTIDFILIGPGGVGGKVSGTFSGGGGGGGGHFDGSYTYSPGDFFNFVFATTNTTFQIIGSPSDYIQADAGFDAVNATAGSGGNVTGFGTFSSLATYGTVTTGNAGTNGIDGNFLPPGAAVGGYGGLPGIVSGSSVYPTAGIGSGGEGYNGASNGILWPDPGFGYVKYRFRLKL